MYVMLQPEPGNDQILETPNYKDERQQILLSSKQKYLNQNLYANMYVLLEYWDWRDLNKDTTETTTHVYHLCMTAN